MYLLPNLIINSSLQSIESPLSQVNRFIGIPLDQNNVKQISLILNTSSLKICSKSTLKHELENIRSILVQNGYPEFLIESRISKKLLRFQQSTKEGPKKCPVYLKLPWMGENSLKFERKIKLSINNCFGAVQPRVIFSTRQILPAIHKDVLPTFQQSNVVYEYVCHCDSRYVVERLNVCRTESASMCRSLFGTELVKNVNNQNAQEN